MFNLYASVVPLVAQMGRHMDWEGSGWFWLWMPLMMIAGIALVAGLVYLVLRGGGWSSSSPRPPGSMRESPLDIAKRRYASGKISSEEFERIKKDLIG
jgi:putative membrane protein